MTPLEMKPVTVISPPWLSHPAVKIIFGVFEKNTFPAFAVGGCVRNAIMNITDVTDIDFATPAPPERVNDMFVEAGYRTEPTGIEHGTVSVIIDHVAYEVTTFRKDVETDGRRAVVEFTDDPSDDAERRDFTFNALYMDSRGNVYDPYAQAMNEPEYRTGIADASHRKLRFVGDAGQRIREDYLRILRLYRFQACLGATVDQHALWACCYYRRGLLEISGERIEKEMLKLLAAESPIEAVTEMVNAEVGAFVFGGIQPDMGRFAMLVHNGPRDAELRLMFLLGNSHWAPVMQHWKSSTALRQRGSKALHALRFDGATSSQLAFDAEDKDVRERMYRVGKQAVIDGAWLAWADSGGGDFAFVARWEASDVPVFPVKGQDFIDAGVKPGPQIGKLLKEIEDRWIEEGFPDRDECLSWIKVLGAIA